MLNLCALIRYRVTNAALGAVWRVSERAQQRINEESMSVRKDGLVEHHVMSLGGRTAVIDASGACHWSGRGLGVLGDGTPGPGVVCWKWGL